MMGQAPRIYLDSNVFIVAFENPGAHADHAWWILRAIEEGRISAATSELTLAEVLVKPIELGDDELVSAYERMLVSIANFEVLTVGREILVEAARIRANRNSIRLPDAVHVATARASSCTHIVSDDRGFPTLHEIKVMGVTPFTLDDILGEAP